MQYRKLPVVIEAARFEQINDDGTAMFAGPPMAWLQAAFAGATGYPGSAWPACSTPEAKTLDCVAIGSLEGTMLALPGDYVIRGVKGELYPCKPDIFEATYEEVMMLQDDAACDERFLEARVSEDLQVIGIDHPTDAPWEHVLAAHIALRDRLNERIAEQEKCPVNPGNDHAEGFEAAPSRDLIAEELERQSRTFAQDVVDLLNKHNMENHSNTPDWILGHFLVTVLRALDCAIVTRDNYYGFEPKKLLEMRPPKSEYGSEERGA